MPLYSYTSPPSGRYFYNAPPPPPPPHSGIHFNDWQAALPVPDNYYVQTWVASPAYGERSPGRSPPMSPQCNDDRTAWPIRAETKRSGRGNHTAESPERRRDKEGCSRDAGHRAKGHHEEDKSNGKEIVKASSARADPKGVQRREQWLVEIRLLLTQLRDQLNTAHYVHKEPFDAFNKHVTSEVKTFANDQTLAKLWVDKLRADAKKNDGKRARDRPVDFDTAKAQVSLCLKHLKNACQKKMPASPGSEGQDAVIDNQINVVISAVENALAWAETAGTNHHACEETMHYLDRAYNFTDAKGQLWEALLDIPAASLPHEDTQS